MSRPIPAARIAAAAFEVLESRRLLSASVSLNGTTLSVAGDDRANSISVIQEGTNLVVRCDGKTRTYSADDVDVLVVDARGGNDRVVFQRADDVDAVRIDGGSGNDDIEIDVVHHPDGPDDALHFSADVNGGSGHDNIELDVETNDAEDPNAVVPDDDKDDDNGNGDDSAEGKLDVNLKIGGGSGDDTIDAEVDLNAGDDGEVAANIDAGSGNDEVDFDVDGAEDDLDTDDADTDDDDADDSETDDDPDGANGGEVDVDVTAQVSGGSGANDVDVQIGTDPGGEHNTGDLVVDVRGGSSNDLLEVSLGGDLDQADHRPTVRISGGSGDDQIGLTLVGTNVDFSKLKNAFKIDGGIGTDTYATNVPTSALKLVSVERRVSSV
jgi:hypothetical protein